MSAKPPSENVARAASGKQVRLNLILAAVTTLNAVLAFATGSPFIGLFLVVTAAFSLWSARVTSRTSSEAYTLNAAYQHYFAGKHAAALAELDAFDAKAPMPYIRRASMLQRVAIAFYEGDLVRAERHAEEAARAPIQRIARLHEERRIAEARAYLVLVRALRDEPHDPALEQAIRGDAESTPSSLARVELAQLIRLERENKIEDLERGVARHRALLLESLSQRERELLYAIQRKLTRRSPGVYRQAAEREVEREEADDVLDRAAWAERVAPTLAPFIRPGEPARPGAEVAMIAAGGATRAMPSNLFTPTSAAAKVALRFAILFFVIVAIGVATVFLTLNAPASAARSPMTLAQGPLVAVGAALAWVLYRRRKQHAARIELAAVTRDAARGLPPDEAKIVALEKGGYPLIAAEAALVHAREARKLGHFQLVEERARAGIAAAVSIQQARVLSASLLLPTLLGERAAALAALGRKEEALAELAQIEASFPAFAFLPVTRHAVVTMIAARDGDLSRLSELSKASQGFPAIDHRTQFLGDLARAAVDPESVGAAEIARIKKDLAQDTALRAWVDKINPALVAALDRGVETAAEDEARADDEAQAEIDADLRNVPGATRVSGG